MKEVSIETAMERVANRARYANHWGQRLLQNLTIPKLGISLQSQAFIILMPTLSLAFFAAAWGGHLISLAPGALLTFLMAHCTKNFVWGDIEKEHIEDLHAWMLDHPELTEACAAWLTADGSLRQRDYRLLKWGRNRIIAYKKYAQSQICAQVHPMHGWIERSKSLVSNFQATYSALPALLNSQMDAETNSKIEALGERLMKMKHSETISLPAWKGRYLNALLKQDITTPIATYANVSGILQTVGTVALFFGIFIFLGFIVSIIVMPPAEPGVFLTGHKNALFAISTFFAVLLALFSLSLRWMMGDAPLSATGTNKMRELATEQPGLAAFFFTRIPKGHYLSYRHFQIFRKMVHIVRTYARKQENEQQFAHMRSAIADLPAAKKSIANAQAKALDAHTHSRGAIASSRRL